MLATTPEFPRSARGATSHNSEGLRFLATKPRGDGPAGGQPPGPLATVRRRATRPDPPRRPHRTPPDDWRRHAPEFQRPNLARNLALRAALRPMARRHDTTVAALAIAWTLSWVGVTGAIVGARFPEQVDGWVRAATLDLTPADDDESRAAILTTGAGAGPALPN